MNIIMMGFLGSLAAGMMTTAGALPILIGRSVSRRTTDAMLGFAAGVMLAASFFSLILPGIGIATAQFGEGYAPAAIAVGGVFLGIALIFVLDASLPHEHFIKGREGPEAVALKKIWLFVLAITIHNMPEGLAVGVGFGGGDILAGSKLAIGIGLQNAPEGLAVAVALMSHGYSKSYAFLVASLTGMIEPVAGLAGAVAVSLSQALLPWGMTLAAGAMICVISQEIIPETHRHGHQKAATIGLGAGFMLMMFLDVAFG
jgi:zinc transporter, ZIP family